jgi:SAM-dependent methyltransferase
LPARREIGPPAWRFVVILTKGLRWLRHAFRRRNFENREFWNTRYVEDPEKGSGPGSRGENVILKNDIVRQTIETHKIKSVLDIGCGDLATMGMLEIERYVGIDISDVIVERNRQLRPQWQFLREDLAGGYRPDPAELVLCFDVLIHQKTRQAYEAILSKALAAAHRVALISGYSHPEHGWKVFFHEPIEQSIRRLCPNAEVTRVTTYRETDLFRVVK